MKNSSIIERSPNIFLKKGHKFYNTLNFSHFANKPLTKMYLLVVKEKEISGNLAQKLI